MLPSWFLPSPRSLWPFICHCFALSGNRPANLSSGSYDVFQRFLVNGFGPAIIIFLLWLLLSALDGMRRAPLANTTASIPRREIVVAVGFACIPLIGLLGCRLSHGPFVIDIFLRASPVMRSSSASSFPGAGPLLDGTALAGCMFLLMVWDIGTTLYFGRKHRIMLIESSSGQLLSTTPANPMAMYESLSSDNTGLDILVLPSIEYIYFFRVCSVLRCFPPLLRSPGGRFVS